MNLFIFLNDELTFEVVKIGIILQIAEEENFRFGFSGFWVWLSFYGHEIHFSRFLSHFGKTIREEKLG
jgi:hypothetical protein